MSCLCFFPFDVSYGRCRIIVSIPDHCLPFYFVLSFFCSLCLLPLVPRNGFASRD